MNSDNRERGVSDLFRLVFGGMNEMINRFDESKAFDYENGFYLTTSVNRMGNILAHYELYKKIIDLPGAVVECGVFRGGTLIQLATFRELLETENSRKIIGFDVFGEFPEAKNLADQKFRESWVNETNNEFLTREELAQSFAYKGVGNVELVKGDILETARQYVADHPELKIAFLHIDTDIYEPAKEALDVFYDRVVKGGVVVFDDYGTVGGETLAVDEFFGESVPELRKIRFSHGKPSYLVR